MDPFCRTADHFGYILCKGGKHDRKKGLTKPFNMKAAIPFILDLYALWLSRSGTA